MILSNVKYYLKNKSYAIDIFENGIYVYNFRAIDHIADNLLIVSFENFKIKIKGHEFAVKKMLDKEVLFVGSIESIDFIYE